MLVLKRREGQWVEVIHRSGDILRIRAHHIQMGPPGRLDLVFDDGPRNFEIRRPERERKLVAAAPAVPAAHAAADA